MSTPCIPIYDFNKIPTTSLRQFDSIQPAMEPQHHQKFFSQQFLHFWNALLMFLLNTHAHTHNLVKDQTGTGHYI